MLIIKNYDSFNEREYSQRCLDFFLEIDQKIEDINHTIDLWEARREMILSTIWKEIKNAIIRSITLENCDDYGFIKSETIIDLNKLIKDDGDRLKNYIKKQLISDTEHIFNECYIATYNLELECDLENFKLIVKWVIDTRSLKYIIKTAKKAHPKMFSLTNKM